MLPDPVHELSITGRQGDQTLTIHPLAVETPTGVLLIDVGLPGGADDLAAALADAGDGFDFGDVRGVVVTHQDGDHAGCLATVSERVAAAAGAEPTVYAHVADAPYVDGRAEPIKTGDERYPSAAVDVEIVENVTFRTDAGPMRVVETHGHTPGHVSLYLPDAKHLLAADALRVDENGRLAGPPPAYTPDEETATESVARLAELTVESVTCFHGGTVTADDARIAEIAAGLREE